MNPLSKFYNAIRSREPAATAGAIQALLILLVKFGVLNLTIEQLTDIQMGVIAVLTYWLRGQVISGAAHSIAVSLLDSKIDTALALPQDANRDDLEEAHKEQAA